MLMLIISLDRVFFFSSRRRHTRCALVTGVQTCALPILKKGINVLFEYSPKECLCWRRPDVRGSAKKSYIYQLFGMIIPAHAKSYYALSVGRYQHRDSWLYGITPKT